MKKLITSLSLIAICIIGCSSQEGGSSASVSTAQSKALSKINNVKGNHSSPNGTNNLSMQKIGTTSSKCYKHEFTMDFQGNFKDPEQIDCAEDINFSSFENDSLKTFTSSSLGADGFV